MRTPEAAGSDLRRYGVAFVAQLVLTIAAVAVSRLELGVRLEAAAVMALAAASGAMVAVVLMGVNRESLLVRLLVLLTLVLIVGLLMWPAWDTAFHLRVF